MIDVTIDPVTSNLVITADDETRAEIPEELERVGSDRVLWDLFESCWANGSFTPFDAGEGNPFVGLTNAPCIAEDLSVEDDGRRVINGRCWWFPNYMVEDPVRTLAETGRVVFTLAPEAS